MDITQAARHYRTKRALEAEYPPQPFTFTGSGWEYFGIWIVNMLLTLVTFGIYSAWAKVRRLQYFYRNTQLAGSIFDYHGNPIKILKGRLIAVAMFVIYQLAFKISLTVGIIVTLALIALLPWLLAKALGFKLNNSSYRGLRFHFHGSVAETYRYFILFPIVLGMTGILEWSLAQSYQDNSGFGVLFFGSLFPLAIFWLTIPIGHYFLKRFQVDHSYFGQMPFFFQVPMGNFIKIYFKAVGLFVLAVILSALFWIFGGTALIAIAAILGPVGFVVLGIAIFLNIYLLYTFLWPYLESHTKNLIWQNTTLGRHRFRSELEVKRLLWIQSINVFLIVCTLGLYKPFAAIRLAKYRIESLTFYPGDDMESCLADQSNPNNAVGQEAADLFDMDIGL